MDADKHVEFTGRARERAVLDGLLARVGGGDSAVLVLRGEAGIGKSVLMDHCARQASGWRIARIAGVASELEMPFAGLHQLCEPFLSDICSLPEPQREALRISFGLAAGERSNPFVVGLGVLGLIAKAASKQPLMCLIDDAQLLDPPTREVLGFVGRRLQTDPVLLLFALRETNEEDTHHALLPGLPTLTVGGLVDEDARALLTAAVPFTLDERIRDRIVAESRGNPLGLLQSPRTMSLAELAGGFGCPAPTSTSRGLEEHYARCIEALPEPARQLLLVAAAEPTGDAAVLWRAAEALGVDHAAASRDGSERLIKIGARVHFRHPIVRIAAYAAGSDDDRRMAHLALAEATDPLDAERRVWHRAAAAGEPDEAVALELEQNASAAQSRAGTAVAAAFLERSAQLTAEPERRAKRALAAARAHIQAGAFDAALGLLAEARALAIEDLQRGRIERLWRQAQCAANPGPEAPVLLLETAKALEPLDLDLARETYLDAWMASFAAGSHARPGGRLAEVSHAARSLPPTPDESPRCGLFLDGFATVVTDGRAVGAPVLRRAVDAFLSDEVSDHEVVQWGHLATTAACLLWDWHSWQALSLRHVELARASGALAPLSVALNGYGVCAALCGDVEAAGALVSEYAAVNTATGIEWYSAGGLLRAAYQIGADALPLISTIAVESAQRGLGQGAQFAAWTSAILCNGLGRYGDALSAATRAAYDMEHPCLTGWALPELIESAVRARQPKIAEEAIGLLGRYTLEGSDWSDGIEARCRALVTEDESAELWYADAIEHLSRTPFRTETARAQLVYGEWLRRMGRRVDARGQLASAYEMFSAIGAAAFAARTHRELLATGEHVRKRDVANHDELTPQERHIARLARDGRSNAEIGAELFLSVRTVEWHLRKVFQKLGIRSRKQLKSVLLSGRPGFPADLSA
jgi:DNA-binding CsgD family transcriptional regulator